MLLRRQGNGADAGLKRAPPARRRPTLQSDIERAVGESNVDRQQQRHPAASPVDVLFAATGGNAQDGKPVSPRRGQREK